MKFLAINSILKTNALLSKLQALDSRKSLEIEVYSCKQTKAQKKFRSIPKPLRFLICALEMAFPDYEFANESMSSFKTIDISSIKSELAYVFLSYYRNTELATEAVSYLDMVISQCVDEEKSSFFSLDKTVYSENMCYKVFLIHDSRMKRIVLIKSVFERE